VYFLSFRTIEGLELHPVRRELRKGGRDADGQVQLEGVLLLLRPVSDSDTAIGKRYAERLNVVMVANDEGKEIAEKGKQLLFFFMFNSSHIDGQRWFLVGDESTHSTVRPLQGSERAQEGQGNIVDALTPKCSYFKVTPNLLGSGKIEFSCTSLSPRTTNRR
jgi:hypothetical protein